MSEEIFSQQDIISEAIWVKHTNNLHYLFVLYYLLYYIAWVPLD